MTTSKGMATWCLDCEVVYQLAPVCPTCGQDSGAPIEGSWWRKWQIKHRKEIAKKKPNKERRRK